VASKIPFDNVVTEALVHSVPVVEYANGIVSHRIEALWKNVSTSLVEVKKA